MASITKKFFNETIKEIYQQTGAVSSLEDRRDHQLLMNSLKNFEAQQVFNWQFILYPLLNGPKESEYQQYAGMRSKPWAEFDSLDPIFGGIHGWTLTAEPWATEDSIPALWDATNKQPHSITGALYYLSEKIQALSRGIEETASEVNTSDLADSLICIEKNIETIYKDVYGCGFTLDCDGEKQNQFSVMTHLYHIFDQIIDGGPNIYVDSFCEPEYPTLSLYLPVSGLTYDTTINQRFITGLGTDLRAIRNFIGMDQPNSVTDYSVYARGNASLNYIADGDSLELSVYNLDQAIQSVASSSSLQTLDQSYYQGITNGNSLPGNIYLRSNENSMAGISLVNYSHVVDENGVVDQSTISAPLGGAAFLVADYFPNYITGDTNHFPFEFEVGQHEVGRAFTLANGTASASNASKFGSWFFDNVHLHKSILSNQPTSGVPNTRGKNDTAPYSFGGVRFGSIMDETALWVADGNNESGDSWLTIPPTARPLDCDGNVIEAENLYFRQPNNGTIYKLNKCGATIQTTSYNGGTSFAWGEDAPLGAVPAQTTLNGNYNHYEPSPVMFVNADKRGVTVGWNGASDTSDEAYTTDTLLLQEHQDADLNKVSLRLRSTAVGSKQEIDFSDGSGETEVDLATIVTGSASDFEFITHDDSKDIVFKPYDTENLRLFANNTAKFSGDLWVAGSLLVDGTTTYINSTTLQVDDKNIELGTVDTPTDTTADGGGITLKASSDKTISWDMTDDVWETNIGLRVSGSVEVGSDLRFGSLAGDEGKVRYANGDFEGHDGTSWVSLTSGGSGGSDNLGNHIATQDLNMSNFEIDNVFKVNMVSSSGQHPEINSPTALDFNSQTASATSVCDYNFGAQTNKPASLNIATGSGGFVNIQAKSGSAVQQILHLPGTAALAGQILKVNSVNGTGQTYLEWSNECCDEGVTGLSAVVEDTAPVLGGSLNAASNSIVGVDHIGFDTTSDHIVEAGQIAWNSDEETFDMGLGGSTLQVGQESHIHVRNNTASTIPNGTAVMAVGSLGSSGRILVERMDASSAGDPSRFLGITTESIAAGADGKITTFGKVRHLNTVGDVWSDGTSRGAASEVWSDGTVLWLNPGVPGELTALQPEAPNLKIAAAYVIHSASNGTIMVRANSGIDLHNNHRVQVSNLQAGDFLFWNSARQRWENTSFNTAGNVIKVANDPNSGEPTFSLDESEIFLAASNVNGLSAIATTGAYSDLSGAPTLSTVATSGSYADLTGAPTIPANTSDLVNDSGFIDQEVTLTGSGATTVTGTFPNFTISSTDTNTNTQLSTEQVQDIVGGMVSGNVENGVNVEYNDTTGKLNFEVTVSGTSLTRLTAHVDYGRDNIVAITPHNIVTIYAFHSAPNTGEIVFDPEDATNGGWINGDTFKVVNLSADQTLTVRMGRLSVVSGTGPTAETASVTLSGSKSIEGYFENGVFYVFQV